MKPRIINKGKELNILLYGDIGAANDGNMIGKTIAQNANDVELIHVRINSPGGDVISGLSIVSALLAVQDKVVVTIEGIAASMAATIAVCGRSIEMNDFGRIMIHNPYPVDYEGDLDEKMKNAVENMRQIISSILQKRGMTSDEIDSLMEKESWFNAQEAKKLGLIDRIISTGKAKKMAAYTAWEVEIAARSINNQNNSKPMKEVLIILGLDENATESQAVDKIKELQTQNQNLENESNELKNVNSDLFLKLGETTGQITDENKDKMKRLADADLGLAIEIVSEKKEEPGNGSNQDDDLRISDILARIKNNANPDKSYRELADEDPQGLKELFKNDFNEFNRLYKAEYGHDYKK